MAFATRRGPTRADRPRRIKTKAALQPGTTKRTITKPRTGTKPKNSRRPKGFKSSTKTEEKKEAIGFADAPESQDYHEEDELIGWKFDPLSKITSILTRRPADNSQRLVSEHIVQRKSPMKLYKYWNSFGQPREVTIGTNHYNVFDIVDHDSWRGVVKVQWVGYSPSDTDTSWEPVSKIRKIDPVLLVHYLARHRLSDRLVRIGKATGLSPTQSDRRQGAGVAIDDDGEYTASWEVTGICGHELRALRTVINTMAMGSRFGLKFKVVDAHLPPFKGK